MTTTQRRLLFISYAFPPTGGAGVQRSVKFSKYLSEFGWLPTVLTAANPSVPVQDSDLPDDINPSTTILTATTLEPAYSIKRKLVASAIPAGESAGGSMRSSVQASIGGLVRRLGMSVLQPDPQILWNPMAYRKALSALRQTKHDAIYVTGPPFSSFLLGRSLKKRLGIPLVVDFRDEWLLASQYLENQQRKGSAHQRQLSMLNKVLRSADAILTTTEASAVELGRYARKVESSASVTCIYNGYDEDDLVGVQPRSSNSNRLRIVYTGTLWTLTDITPMVAALKHVALTDPQAAGQIELVVAGRRTPEQESILGQLESTPVIIERHDYLSHRSSLDLAASSDILLLLLADQPGAQRVVPAKLFEYLALCQLGAGQLRGGPLGAGQPILGICGPGETAQLLSSLGQPNVFRPEQTEQIANWLVSQLRSPIERTTGSDNANLSIERFSRRELTRQLADVLQVVLSTD